ncbi:MAG: FAD synthase [Candidatus Thorarchaeota archaeon]|nr:MAG: FAD synthase [Candidatus Thorarchaeota archaeon]
MGKRVLAAGKFDILHLGHIAYLQQAKELSGPHGELVVIIALDKTIERERGAPPVFPEEQRRKIVESLKFVDKAILGYDTNDHREIVLDIRPDIIALGYDQVTDTRALEKSFAERGLTTRIVRLEKGDAGGLCSSTLIRSRIISYYSENGRARDTSDH